MNNTQKMISAVAHTANYLKQCATRLEHVEDQICDVSMQLDELQATLGYGTQDYWDRQRIEIFKILLECNLLNYKTQCPSEVKLLFKEASDMVEQLRAADNEL